MSGAMYYKGKSISFLVARSDQGGPNFEPVPQEEVLETPGVNGRRWRVIFRQYERMRFFTVTDCTNYADALDKKELAESFKGKLVRLEQSIDVASYATKDAHVEAVEATAFPGPAVGNGATGTAHLVATWVIVPTEF
jgi:hypothetical protein